MKKKRNEKKSEKDKLAEEEKTDQNEDLVAVEQMQREGTVAIHDTVLNEMEKKHANEQEVKKPCCHEIAAREFKS